MKSFEVHEAVKNENPTTGFSSMEGKDQIWLSHDDRNGGDHHLDHQEEDLLDVSDASMFYTDFPPLPDFPCMSQSSSSSSTPAPTKPMASTPSSSSASSSSAASWAVLKSDAEDDVDRKSRNHNRDDHFYDHHKQQDPALEASTATLSSTESMDITQQPSDQKLMMEGVDCMDVMENLGYMDLLENTDFFDPSSIFQHEENILDGFQLDQKPQEDQLHHHHQQQLPPPHDDVGMVQNDTAPVQTTQHADDVVLGGSSSDDLAMVFLEWLKSNKEMVSAEDLRKVKIKKSTIECAARRLGGGKEAMKQLLKLILEWVQTNHLQRRRLRESSSTNLSNNYQNYHQDPIQNPKPSPNPNTTNYNCNPIPPPPPPDHSAAHPGLFNQWIPPPAPYVADPGSVVPGYPPMVGYMGDPYGNGPHPQAYQNPPEYHHHMLDLAHSWPMSQLALASHYSTFGDSNLQSAPANTSGFPGYGNQYPYQYPPGHGDGQVRLGSSATKEARKKRMARQRRFLSHHRSHNSQHNQNRNQGNDSAVPAGNWVYWHTGTGTVGPMDAPAAAVAVDRAAMQGQNYQKQGASDRRQGWKPEKNLRFLLQKVLKQSDVGSLGRIVLPKKEAETHLPELDARDGISIAMEDIGTSRVWNMRYSFRFWPNNKSRMYLLENTGDFVKANGLQEGDFIVIYSDVKCGKYLIRGVKVRQAGPKTENKRGGKSQKNSHNSSCAAGAATGNNANSSSTPKTETVK